MPFSLVAGACRAIAFTASALLFISPVRAADTTPVKIGFITDMSGLYADSDGRGGAEAIRMSIADFGGKVLGRPVELLTVDHQNKADIAAAKAREWIDRDGVNMIIGGSNSATGLATNQVTGEKKIPYINVSGGSDEFTNEQCTPYTVHYAYDTMSLAKGTASAVTKLGGKSWYFLSADYAFGKAMEKNSSAVVLAKGGEVLGTTRHPLSATDFSSFLIQAQNSKAQVLALANAGGDAINSIKAAREFGVNKTMKIAPMLLFLSDVHSLGLQTAQGLVFTDHWYWNQNEKTRKWATRYFEKMKRMPTALQAADYSATTSYLRAVDAAGGTDSDKVMAQLKKLKIDDFYARGYIRDDGSMIHDMYLMQVKTPSESKEPWDYYKVLETIPGEYAFGSKAETRCKLWK